jgi:type I restriction enzyme S subunit
MECGGSDAALAGLDLGSVPEDAPGAGRAEEGELPDGWRWSPVSEITRTFTGGTPSREHSEYFGGSIKWAKSGDLNDGVLRDTEETITDEGLAKSNAKKCPAGTLLVALYGATTGKVALLAIEAAINQAICALVPTAASDSEFLMYALTHRRAALLRERYGGAQPNISQTVLRAFELPLPPLPEQQAIAAVLRTVQGAKEACEQVLAATRQLKQSLLHHLFTYGPVPFSQAANVPRKETEIGPMPEHWDAVQLGTVANVRTSTSPVSSIPRATAQPGGRRILFLKVSDLNHPANQRRVVTSAATFSVDDESERALKLVPEGAIVLPKRGAAIATNKKRLTTCGCLLDPNLVGVIPGPQLVSDYLYAWFERFDLRTITDTTTLPQINKKDLEPLQIPLPPLPEQREIAAQLAAVDAKLAAEESRRSALVALFQSLLQHLMTGKVRLPEFGGPQP